MTAVVVPTCSVGVSSLAPTYVADTSGRKLLRVVPAVAGPGDEVLVSGTSGLSLDSPGTQIRIAGRVVTADRATASGALVRIPADFMSDGSYIGVTP